MYVLYYSEAKSVTRRMEDGRISERSTRTADKELPESRRTLSRKLPVRRTYTSYSKGSPRSRASAAGGAMVLADEVYGNSKTLVMMVSITNRAS